MDIFFLYFTEIVPFYDEKALPIKSWEIPLDIMKITKKTEMEGNKGDIPL